MRHILSALCRGRFSGNTLDASGFSGSIPLQVSTTNLFVELIVIGSGAASWLSLLLLSVFGHDWLGSVDPKHPLMLPALVPLLAFVYVLGIVVDRGADRLFDRFWISKARKKSYEKEERPFFDDRRLALLEHSPSTELFLYGRSRLRICRGWTVNAVLIALALGIFLVSHMGGQPLFWQLLLCGDLFFLLLALGCWLSWKGLKESDYIKVKEQAEFLRSRSASARSTDASS